MTTPKKKDSALRENPGISPPEMISSSAVGHLKEFRKTQPSSVELIDGILKGDITSLSRAITIIESTNPSHLEKAHEIIAACLPHANQSVRIGITGVPGVGKSTFIEAFGKQLTGLGKKVAVLAVDPSSTISHGSILGDKTREWKNWSKTRMPLSDLPPLEKLWAALHEKQEKPSLCAKRLDLTPF